MKYSMFLIIISLCFGGSSCAQNSEGSDLPMSVAASFKSKFPQVENPKWEMESASEYEAEFKLNGKEMSAVFAASGEWKETETEIKVSALPAAVSTKIKATYPGAKITEASSVMRPDCQSCYEAEVKVNKETMEILLNEDGTIKSTSEAEEDPDDKD